MQFTAAQQQAIEHTNGHLQLIACAGAGKTEVLARRVAHLLTPGANAVTPDQIVAFTFTDKAARELRDRIQRRCRDTHGDLPGLNELFVGTMHGYCRELLQRHTPEYFKFRTLNQVQQHLLINRHSRQSGLTVSTDLKGDPLRRYTDTAHYAAAMNLLRDARLNVAELAGCSVYESLPDYCALLHERSFFDFAAIMQVAVAALETNSTIRDRLATRLRHVIVDEYQDSSPVQERLVRALHDLGATTCVVGDDDQTIYQWRGSDVRNIQTFAARYPGVTQLRLDDNFRSSEAIVALGRAVVELATERLPKAMRSTCAQSFEAGDLTAVACANPDAEAEHIATTMQALRGVAFTENGVSRGLDWSDMAVLCRSVNQTAPRILAALADAGVPAVVVGMGGWFDAPEAEACRVLFRFLAGDADVDAEGLHTSWEKAGVCKDSATLTRALRWAAETRRQILGGGGRQHPYYGLQRAFWSFLKALGLQEDQVPDGRGEVVFYNLGRFSQLISDFEDINYATPPQDKYPTFAKFLVYQAEKAYPEGSPDESLTAPNAVRVMTVHQAKGLQWPVVFVPGLGRNRFPLKGHGGRNVWHLLPETGIVGQERFEGGEDDERRLLYVAVTRSQKFLHVSWAPEMSSRLYTRPSVFFNEIAASPWVNRASPDFARRPRLAPSPKMGTEHLELGYSDFQRYMDCPYAYKLRVLCGFNPPLHEALGYGQSIHNILAELHGRWQAGEAVPERDVPALVDRHLHLPFAYESLRQELRVAGIDVVRRYVRATAPQSAEIAAYETPVELDTGAGVTLRGRIDLLRRPLGGSTELVDFKSSHGAADAASVETQLLVYAAALEAATGERPGRLSIHDLASGRVQQVDASPEADRSVRAKLVDAAQRLRNADFRPCLDAKRCESCDQRILCPGGRLPGVERAG